LHLHVFILELLVFVLSGGELLLDLFQLVLQEVDQVLIGLRVINSLVLLLRGISSANGRPQALAASDSS
jgi:hypothetical protein